MKTSETKKTYQAQQWDSDVQDWEDMEGADFSGNDRLAVTENARHEAGKCAYRLRVRVVEVKGGGQ